MDTMKIAVIAVMFALIKSAHALQACPLSPPDSDWVWRAGYDIAAKLPPSASENYGQGAEGNADIWNVPGGKLDARYGIAPISWWTFSADALCETRIDGFSATIYQIVSSHGLELAAVLPRAALGKDLAITVPLRDGKRLATELAMLTNIVFLNDPQRLRVLSTDMRGATPHAVIRDELGRELTFGLGDYISERAGVVWQIDKHSVVTKSGKYVDDNPLPSLTLHHLPVESEDQQLSSANKKP
jgi:hypothetical protein